MTGKKNMEQIIKEERKIILEMISASWELSKRLGKHGLKNGCNCIACINKRKRLLNVWNGEWKFRL